MATSANVNNGYEFKRHSGKTILFTDNQNWSDEAIVLGYRSQYDIESAFRDMKNPHFLGWSPMFHWTDSKIRVHTFYCVLALMLISLLQRTLHPQGVETRAWSGCWNSWAGSRKCC